MKKLNLQLGSIKEMLTKEQMKKVVGGYDGNCAVSIPLGTPQCGFSADKWCVFSDHQVITGLSSADVSCLTNGVSGAHYCCTDCSTASWLPACISM